MRRGRNRIILDVAYLSSRTIPGTFYDQNTGIQIPPLPRGMTWCAPIPPLGSQVLYARRGAQSEPHQTLRLCSQQDRTPANSPLVEANKKNTRCGGTKPSPSPPPAPLRKYLLRFRSYSVADEWFYIMSFAVRVPVLQETILFPSLQWKPTAPGCCVRVHTEAIVIVSALFPFPSRHGVLPLYAVQP